MNLQELHIQGFETYANELLRVSKLGPGLIFIKGENLTEPSLGANGAGKSGLWAALFWCLYGKTVDGRKSPDIKPWKLKNPTKVTAKIDDHEISRSLAPNLLTIDGKEVGQEHVDQLLGISFDLASHTVLMGQNRPLFFDLKPTQKMELFTEALGLEQWETRSRAASEATSAKEKELLRLESDYQSQCDLETELYGMIQSAKTKAKDWDAREQVDLDKVESSISGKKKGLEKAQMELAKYDLIYDGLQTELRAISVSLDKLQDEKRKTQIQIDRGERLLKELESLDKAKTCPTCGQPIAKKDLANHRSEMASEIEDLGPVQESLINLEERIQIQNEAKISFSAKSNEAQDCLFRYKQDKFILEVEISTLKNSIAKRQEETNPFQEQLIDLRKRRSQAAAMIDTIDEKQKDIESQVELNKFWIKGFKEIRLYIIEEILQEMELVTNATLAEVGLINWKVHYEVEKETKSGTTQRGLNVWIKSPANKEPVRWECWSGGESRRLKIVGAACLSDVLLGHAGAECGFEVFDEPTASLSQEGVDDLIEFLANRAKDHNKTIFLVDHMAIESSLFTSVITVVKEKDISHVRQQE